MNHQTKKECFKTSVGGQALMEGIMMRGPKQICCAVRRPDGSIETKLDPIPARKSWMKIPIVRGGRLDDREPCGGLPLHDVLGPGQHGGGLRRGRRGDRL